MVENKKELSGSRDEYLKKYMKLYIHDEKKGGKMEHCEACNSSYKKYNRHHHKSTAKHIRNKENSLLKIKELERITDLENTVKLLLAKTSK